MKIFITGGTGLVGSKFINLNKSKYSIVAPTINELDITNEEAVTSFVIKEKPNVIINFAAYTDVKNAQLDKGNKEGITWRVNVEAPRLLAKLALQKGIHFIHISTDLIFPGKNYFDESYYEADMSNGNPDNLSWYGYSKLCAENAIKEITNDCTIVRIAYPFDSFPFLDKKDFLFNFINMYDSQKMYPLFTDNQINPTYINVLSEALNTIIERRLFGIFHVVSANATSHHAFAKRLFDLTNRSGDILQTTMKEFIKTNSSIPRAIYSKLDVGQTEKLLGMKLPTWEDCINTCLTNNPDLIAK